ncbi:MAG: DUF2141 domain-containing protein [Pseudolabrys sp.]
MLFWGSRRRWEARRRSWLAAGGLVLGGLVLSFAPAWSTGETGREAAPSRGAERRPPASAADTPTEQASSPEQQPAPAGGSEGSQAAGIRFALGVDQSGGDVYCGLFTEQSWPRRPVDYDIEPVDGDDTVICEFQNVEPGAYALAAFHDENGNRKLDRDWIGLPDEGLSAIADVVKFSLSVRRRAFGCSEAWLYREEQGSGRPRVFHRPTPERKDR